MFDAEKEVAEWTVDVLAAALNGRVVGRVDEVHRQAPANLAIVAGVKGVQLLVSGSGRRCKVLEKAHIFAKSSNQGRLEWKSANVLVCS